MIDNMGNNLLMLAGKHVSLRSFAESDITEDYIGWLNDPAVVRYSNQRFVRHTLESCRQYLLSFVSSANMFLAISKISDGKMIGTITAYLAVPHCTADIGILIGNRGYWGKGLGFDAWATLMNYLLGERNIRKVTGGTLNCNVGMIHIMEKCGMHLEAIRKQQEIVEGKAQDALYFAKFRDD